MVTGGIVNMLLQVRHQPVPWLGVGVRYGTTLRCLQHLLRTSARWPVRARNAGHDSGTAGSLYVQNQFGGALGGPILEE